jgi:DNA-binding NarL/FixJ family response regulator
MNSRFVLVVEDDALLRELLASALEAHGFQVQTASNAADAKRAFRNSDPDGVVMDVDLGPGPNGFDLAQTILHEAPETGIVFLTQFPDSRFASAEGSEIPKGVAYLRKSALSDLSRLFDALDAAMRGNQTEEYRDDLDRQRPLANLTRKQIQILKLMSLGQSNAQIATNRGTTIKAVEDAVRRACIAIGVNSDTENNSRTAAVARFLTLNTPQTRQEIQRGNV